MPFRDNRVNDVRYQLADELLREHFVVDKSGVRLIEIPGAAFLADEPSIFGTVNEDYVERELQWYLSHSLNVHDIPGKVPEIWLKVADADGFINSNYGWMVFSQENGSQYQNVFEELIKHPTSRRAVVIYQRPSMWTDYSKNGRSDFVCTNAVQYLIRDGFLDAVVQMRSNDVTFGYKNDFAWQNWVLKTLAEDLSRSVGGSEVVPGMIYWNVGSLHVYERDFYLVDNWYRCGDRSITKKEYKERYPESPWAK